MPTLSSFFSQTLSSHRYFTTSRRVHVYPKYSMVLCSLRRVRASSKKVHGVFPQSEKSAGGQYLRLTISQNQHSTSLSAQEEAQCCSHQRLPPFRLQGTGTIYNPPRICSHYLRWPVYKLRPRRNLLDEFSDFERSLTQCSWCLFDQ